MTVQSIALGSGGGMSTSCSLASPGARFNCRESIMRRQKCLCYYCGGILTSRKGFPNTATIDHKIPRWDGGSDDPSNLVVACQTCNEDKDNLDESEYRLALILARLPFRHIFPSLIKDFRRTYDIEYLLTKQGDCCYVCGKTLEVTRPRRFVSEGDLKEGKFLCAGCVRDRANLNNNEQVLINLLRSNYWGSRLKELSVEF
jgi:hypothetical protein